MRYRYSAGEDGKLRKKAVIYTKEEHGINFTDVDAEAVSIVMKLKNAGFETYIVGGAVRDLALGNKPKDFDIVSAASPLRIKKLFHNARIIGRRFRLVHVCFGRKIYEVSTFRSLKDGHTSNTFGNIDDDVFRRDFTMNALFYDPAQQIVIDYIGGMNDIKKKLVKPVIPLSNIFTDDPIRMIRAVKYAAMTGFSLPINLKVKIKSQSELLKSISHSRLTEEILKIIRSNAASAIVNLLDKMGLYFYLQPCASDLMHKDQDYKKKYLETLAVLDGTETYKGQALASLFSDYLDIVIKQNPEISTDYRDIYQYARKFVLPMNPPKYEFGSALRKYLASGGFIINKPQTELPKTAPTDNAAPPSKKRRRHRKPRQIIKSTDQPSSM